MDEHAYRQQLAARIEHPCPFAKAVLSTCVRCSQATRVPLAEREVIACRSPAAWQRCVELYAQLRHNFGFALHVLHDDAPLPHAQSMRLQCGGLKGLQVVAADAEEVADVAALLEQVLQRWGKFEAIPYSALVQAAARCYKGRHG